ncbi:hypothetical protein B0I37DRAFT_336882 [Chaetomium sp. MPI-CAGE-AT-0009]|nr:hypothetical protein B0I37DRAFT_336882 [Chaetomium sp. MPI-CAGE-AT-0009]
MVTTRRERAEKIFWKGRTYYPLLPPCMQPDAVKITTGRLWGREPDDAVINETELREFAQIFPRLYQVGGRSQARIRAWVDHNKDTIWGWDLGDFLKTPAADARDGTKPRRPGCPEEVMEAWRTTNQGVDDHLDTRKLPPTGDAQGPQKNCQDAIKELDASLGTIKAVACWLESLWRGLDGGDLIKKELFVLARTLHTKVDRARRAEKAVSQHLNNTAASDSGGKKRGHDQVEDTKGDKDGDPKRVRKSPPQDLAGLEVE